MRALPRKRLLAGAWIFVTYVVLMLAATLFGERYGRAMVPLYRWEIGQIQSQYRVVSLELAQADNVRWFRLTVANNRPVFQGKRLVPPGTVPRGVETPLEDVLQHLVLTLLVPLAWPGLGWKRRLAAILLVVPLLLVVELADVPWTFAGLLDHRDGEPWSGTFFLSWVRAMQFGGRFALSLAAGLSAVGLASLGPRTVSTRHRQMADSSASPQRL